MGPVATGLRDDMVEIRDSLPTDPGNTNAVEWFKVLGPLGRLAQVFQFVWTHLANETGGDTSLQGPAAQFLIETGSAFRAAADRNHAGFVSSMNDAIEVLEAT